MPRLKNETDALVSDLADRLERLVAAARQEGREAALAEVRSLVGGATNVSPARPRTAANSPMRKTDGRRNSWSIMTPAARLKRVNAIRAGKGLPPKDRL